MKTYIGTKIIQAELQTRASDNQVGYRVVYPDGYESWSPFGVFDAAYRPCGAMTFGLALDALKLGKLVQRSGWNGKGLTLELQVPDARSKMTLPYIVIVTGLAPARETTK